MSEQETTFDRAETPEEEAALLAARAEAVNRAQAAVVIDATAGRVADLAEQAMVAEALASLSPVEAPAGVPLAPVLQESAIPPKAGPLATPGAAPARGELVAFVLDDGSDAEALVIAENGFTPTLLVQVAPEFSAAVTRRQFPAVPFGDSAGCWHHLSDEVTR